ncbi:MAG: hypothetical protein OER95_06115 [Acidimicrobiia bacterium]|nr:hypothetical protein [Acidimicrobiia bacterium]
MDHNEPTDQAANGVALEAISLPRREAEAIAAVVDSLVAPGPTLSGTRRRELATAARQALGDEAIHQSTDAELRLAVTMASAAHTIRPGDVERVLAAGLEPTTYVEILSLVARLVAVDTVHFGLGLDPIQLPQPVAGTPSGWVDAKAAIDGGWLPTVGPAAPPNALSLLPGEHQAMHDLHGALYLSVEEMADTDATRGLHRTQMELVAARTSLLNECFF